MRRRDGDVMRGILTQSWVIREALKEEGHSRRSSKGWIDFSLGERWLLGRRTFMARGMPSRVAGAPYTAFTISLLLLLSPSLVWTTSLLLTLLFFPGWYL